MFSEAHRRMVSLFTRGLFALTLCFALTSRAQPVPAFELERLRLNPAAAHGLLVDSADLLPQFGYRVALNLHYQRDPLVLVVDEKRAGAVVSDRLGVHLSGAFGITEWLEVNAQLPVVLLQRGEDLSALSGATRIPAGAALGTPWLGARVAPFQQRRGHPLDVSLGVQLGLPFGSDAALTRDTTVSLVPSIAVGRTLGSYLRLGGGVSVLVRPTQQLTPTSSTPRDEVGSVVSVGAVLATNTGHPLRGELSARLDLPTTRTGVAGEVDLGVRYLLFDMVELYAVGGPGFGSLPGTPAFRVLGGVALAPRARTTPPRPDTCVEGSPYELAACPALDRDGDGVTNTADACPEVLGVASLKGCPELDTDGDGLLDGNDACPAVVGLRSLRGCPEPDADRDGIADARDRCPQASGLPTHDGCPDTDGDGQFDDVDACVAQSGVAELRGCPDTDADGDGVVDRLDACRAEAGVADNSGCPKAKRQLVVIEKDRLVIREQVQFATGKSAILPRSFPLLEQVASLIKDHPEVEKVSIEGHTDGRGGHDANVKLSRARAESVRAYLLKLGLPADRIDAQGFGPDRPVATNATPQGREANRRVEFVIIGAERTRSVP